MSNPPAGRELTTDAELRDLLRSTSRVAVLGIKTEAQSDQAAFYVHSYLASVPQMLAGHLAEIAAMAPRPGLVWLQSGIRSDGFVHDLAAYGIDVVQDRCLMVDHRRLAR